MPNASGDSVRGVRTVTPPDAPDAPRPLQPFSLEDFVRESNRIEGIPEVRVADIEAHELFLDSEVVSVGDLVVFVRSVAGAELRDRPGMNVRVGPHIAPPGGAKIVGDLEVLLRGVNERRLSSWEAHHRYETLHPFSDGNGRSGRALWLWQVGGIGNAPLGFLHSWYYQSLQAKRVGASRPGEPEGKKS